MEGGLYHSGAKNSRGDSLFDLEIRESAMRQVDAVIFDIGNVLVHWQPEALMAKVEPDPARRAWLMQHVVTPAWNREFDGGKLFADGVAERLALHPEHEVAIRAWHERFDEMITGPIEANVAVLAALRQAGVPVYAITNYSAETFAHGRKRFDFYNWFDDCVVSGEVGLLKPDKRIYRLLIDRNGLKPERAVFIDDTLANVEAAAALGLKTVHFEHTGVDLRGELAALGLPV